MPIRPFAQRKQNVGSPLTHEYRRNGFRSARRFHLLSPGNISAIRSCCFFHASPRRAPALPVTKHHAQGTYMTLFVCPPPSIGSTSGASNQNGMGHWRFSFLVIG